MQLVVPMAGLGQRFVDAGYTLPKPLIPVGGLPMVVRVVRGLPPATRTVFVCHPEHAERYRLADELTRHMHRARIIIAEGLTQGQACSVRLAVPELDLDEPVLVAACDCTQIYDKEQFVRRTADTALDALVWTYRGEPRVLVRPEAYGWVREQEGMATHISVKKPLSTSLLDDDVISGTFWFRSARLLAESIDALVASDRRVNGEFYLDSVSELLLTASRRVGVFRMDKYIGWGTPEDLEDYERWERHFYTRELPLTDG